MDRKKPLFRVKKQRVWRRHAIFKPKPSPWSEIAPVSASLLALGVTDTDALTRALAVPPYHTEQDTVWIAHTSVPHADANSMLHTLLDALLPQCKQMCELMQTHGVTYRLSLSFGDAEPPALVILDGNLCRFLYDIKAERDPDFSIF